MAVVDVKRIGDVATIALNNPPVNAMSAALRQALVASIDELEGDPGISAIALHGEGRCFCAGADITEFGGPQSEPLPPDVTMRIEACDTPLAVVLHGTCLGGGLEMGLAAHTRVATPDARLGLPEVGIGLIPGAGGCVRSPHLIGWEAAYDFVTSGRQVSADEALAMGLVDQVRSGDPADLALEAAQDLVKGDLEARKTSLSPLGEAPGLAQEWAQKVRSRTPFLVAPQKAVEAVAAAALPSDEAFQRERDLFFECLTGPQSAALIHAFSTERAVWKIPEADHSPRAIDRVGVVGGGTMGSGIATAALLAGFPLVLAEQNSEAGARAKSVIASNLDGAVKRGKISDAKRQALLDENLTVETDLEALASQDLIIEAVFEDMAVKSDIFGRLDRAAKPGAILASNTSCLDLNEIARGTSRPQSVIGLHFFSPAHVMRLLEVVVGAETAPEVTAAGFALARKLRKVAVRAGVCEGFIGNRILHHYLDAADHLVLAGAEPEAVDNAMQEFGFALGPFAVNDLAGIDISIATRTREGVGSKPTLEQRMAEAGWLGRKSGKGYYVYEGKDRTANPELPELIAATRASAGLTPRAFDSEEIVDRIMTAMVAEASRVLEEGIALRPIDIDAVYLFGYGFPRFLGGPMHYADAVGAKMVLERIERFAELDGDFWRAPAILRRMAKDGSRFADMNR